VSLSLDYATWLQEEAAQLKVSIGSFAGTVNWPAHFYDKVG